VTRLLFPLCLDLLCLVGLYAASFMQGKANRFARGELDEPSVVTRPQARAVAGIPNSAFGISYYVLLGVAAWLLAKPLVYDVALAAAIAAAAFSAFLAYSLLFITRMPCAFCWTGHVVNWSLLALLIAYRFLT
jgi:uncharacterized membrane protein